MTLRGITLALLLLAGMPAAAQERDAFTFTDYKLAVTIHPQQQTIEARGSVILRNDSSAPQKKAFLQISSALRWATVRAGTQTLAFTQSTVRSDVDHTGSVEEAQVTLPAAIQPQQSLELEVGYSGRILLNAQRLERLGTPGAVAAHTDYDLISAKFTIMRGMGHVLWFPAALEAATLDQENKVFRATEQWRVRHVASRMELELTIDGPPQTVITNADSNEIDAHDQQRQTILWRSLGLSGPVLVMSNYAIASGPMTLAYIPAHQEGALQYAEAIKNFEPPLRGPQKVTPILAELPEQDDEAFDGGKIFLLPIKMVERRSFDLTLAYVWAHATIASPRPWISEGGAHYAQALMRERQQGRRAAIEFLNQKKPGLSLIEPDISTSAGNADQGESLINASEEIYYRTKAMFVWWMLRDLVGEGVVAKALLHYRPEEDRSPAYMQKLLEAESHTSLEWFFDDWVYRDRGLPELKVSDVYARESLRGAYLVTIPVENSGAAAAEVPVIVTTKAGDVMGRLRVPAHGSAVARIEVGSTPLSVAVNDGSVPETDLRDNSAPVKLPQ